MTDTHAHLNLPAFADDLPAVMARAAQAGVTTIIVVGVDIPSSRRAIALAETFSQCWATVGIHPHDAEQCTPGAIRTLRELARAPKVVAIGETGLDYYRLLAPKELQQRAFRAQLALAAECHLPVVVHNRDAHADVEKLLAAHLPPRKAVMHCFSGQHAHALSFLALGCYIAIAGNVTFPTARVLREVAQGIPEDRLLVETDCPYLTPVPQRGRRNEPSFVVHTLRALATVKGKDPGALEATADANARQFFGIPADGQPA